VDKIVFKTKIYLLVVYITFFAYGQLERNSFAKHQENTLSSKYALLA
jgi:hypothetical protein